MIKTVRLSSDCMTVTTLLSVHFLSPENLINLIIFFHHLFNVSDSLLNEPFYFLVAPAAEEQSDLSSHYGVCLFVGLFVCL